MTTATATDPRVAEVNDYLAQCNGTDTLYTYGMFRKQITSGVKYVADKLGAFWLLDVVFSHQLNRKAVQAANGFQVWRITLNKTGSGCKVTMDDGGQDGNAARVLITQRITFTDFPRGVDLVLYYEGGVLMLKEER
jgi:hypothetical protein